MEKDHQLIRSGGGDNPSLLRSNSESIRQTASSPDFILQWGNRKRLRCMKVQSKDKNKADSVSLVHRTTSLLERRVLRPEKDSPIHPGSIQNNGYLNLRHRLPSPQPSPPPRILRNSEASGAMRGHSNGGVRGITSPEKANNHNISQNENNKSAVTSEIAGHDGRKGCSSFGTPSGELVAVAAPSVWPPKFVIALTNKEKEEDFLAIKGSKLSQRPKKRAKIIQRALNLVCPGGWLCDLTLERYEVREKKISKKRPRGLKAMGNMESESEY